MKISLFTTCRNRQKNLSQSLPSWQNQNVDEIVILDYGSDVPIKNAYRVHADRFQITRALNIAESICTGDVLIKVDCDYILNVDIIKAVNLQPNEFYSGAHVKHGLDGFLMCWKVDFEKVNGYNENLLYYGFDDTDLYERLEQLGVRHNKIHPDWITHIPHSNVERLKEYKVDGRKDKHLDHYLKINKKIATENPWTVNNVRSKYVGEGILKDKIHLIVCIGIDFDIDYIPHFIDYYKKFEIYSFNFILHTNIIDNLGLMKEMQQLIISKLPNSQFQFWNGEFTPTEKSEYINRFINSISDWYLVVDVDEFVEFPNDSVMHMISSANLNIFYGRFYDKISNDGKIKKLTSQNIFTQFPKEVDYTKNIGGCIFKPVLFKDQKLKKTLHSTSRFTVDDIEPKGIPILKIHHFKWVTSTKEKLVNRKNVYKRNGYTFYKESELALKKYY